MDIIQRYRKPSLAGTGEQKTCFNANRTIKDEVNKLGVLNQ